MVQRSCLRVAAGAAAVALVSWGLSGPALADPPAPSPVVPTSAAGPTEPSPTSTPSTTTPSTTTASTPSGAQTIPGTSSPSSGHPAEVDGPDEAPVGDLTLAVRPLGGPVADAFYEDLGSFGFSGTSTLGDETRVTVQRRVGSAWRTAATAGVSAGAYTARADVEAAGSATFRVVTDTSEGASVTSEPVTVSVRDATVAVTVPSEVDALENLPVSGRVVPARAGVVVHVDVQRGSTPWTNATTVTTGPDGSFSASIDHEVGRLRSYDLRATYRASNRSRWERSTKTRFSRIAVLDPEVDPTSKADVKKTYRKGCPVGRSRLSTIHLSYYGRDRRMHRGVIIIRTDLRQEIIRGFSKALEHRYPIAKMKNPNAYGGNDPKQMKANNTSGFNCRKVVGNPYKMSPHSYGIAIDVNTVQNPYRDGHGRWWPSNGKKYRDRTPLRWGMLGKSSWLTKSLRRDHFFWGGRWNPGRDYQHFEYRG